MQRAESVPWGALQPHLAQDALAQADGVGVAHVVDPAAHGAMHRVDWNLAPAVVLRQPEQAALEVERFAWLQAPVLRENDKAQKRDALADGARLRARMSSRLDFLQDSLYDLIVVGSESSPGHFPGRVANIAHCVNWLQQLDVEHLAVQEEEGSEGT